MRDLFLFAKQEGYRGRIQSDAPKASARFGFYMHVIRADGTEGSQQFFNYVDGAKKLVVYVKWPEATMPAAVLEEYRGELRDLFGPSVDAPEPNIPLVAIAARLDEFKNVVRKLQARIDPDLGASS